MNMHTMQGVGTVIPSSCTLNIAGEGFIYRGTTLFNKLNENLIGEPKLSRFKEEVRKWVKSNIPNKPKPTFTSISVGS